MFPFQSFFPLVLKGKITKRWSVSLLLIHNSSSLQIDVNGKHAHPLYEYMKKECPGFMGTKAVKVRALKEFGVSYKIITLQHVAVEF